MRFAQRFETDIKLAFFKVSGECTISELLEVEKFFKTDPRRKPDMSIIADLFDADLSIALDDLKNVLNMNRERAEEDGGLMPTAVVHKSKFLRTLTETLRVLGDSLPIKLEVFNVLPDALQWLGMSAHLERIEIIRAELAREIAAGSDLQRHGD